MKRSRSTMRQLLFPPSPFLLLLIALDSRRDVGGYEAWAVQNRPRQLNGLIGSLGAAEPQKRRHPSLTLRMCSCYEGGL